MTKTRSQKISNLKTDFEKNVLEHYCKLSQDLNLFSDVRLQNAELIFILWRENCTKISAFCSCGARIKADVTMCGHDLESSNYTSKKIVYKSGQLHVLVRKYSMSKLTNDREILYFQTAVLAEPSDYNSCRIRQNS
jgi:hypothetical protein